MQTTLRGQSKFLRSTNALQEESNSVSGASEASNAMFEARSDCPYISTKALIADILFYVSKQAIHSFISDGSCHHGPLDHSSLDNTELQSRHSHSAYIQHTKQITHEITAVCFGLPSEHFVDTTHALDISEILFCTKGRLLQERNCRALLEFCSMSKQHLKQFHENSTTYSD